MTCNQTKKNPKTLIVSILDISQTFCVGSYFPSLQLCLWGGWEHCSFALHLRTPLSQFGHDQGFKDTNCFSQLCCYVWQLQGALLKSLTWDHRFWQLNIALISPNPSVISICLWLDYTSHAHNISVDGIKLHFV